MEELIDEDKKLVIENEEVNNGDKKVEKEDEEKKITKRDILNLLKERREIRKNNRQITATICLIQGKRKINGIEDKVTEVTNDMVEQAKMYGKKAERMAKTIERNYIDKKREVAEAYTNKKAELTETYINRKEEKQNIIQEYKNALETIEKEYVEREEFIIENRGRFEKAQEESALKELELREKRDKIRETPEYAEHVIKEEQWLKEALQENNLDTLQEKKKKYEELKAQNPLTEYDEKIKEEKERRKKITDFIEKCDNVLLECEKEKEESISQATKNKKNQLVENKQNVFQKVMGGIFYKINGMKKFASKVIGELEEKVYDINNKTLPAVREKISDGIDKSIEDIKQTCTQIADNTMKMAEDKLTQSIEKAKQVNVKRKGKFDVLMGETEGQK